MAKAMSTSAIVTLASRAATTDIPTASQAFGFGAALGYQLASRGEFPCRVLRLGRFLRVPTADLLQALGLPHPESDALRRT
jgi:hypothetical protein